MACEPHKCCGPPTPGLLAWAYIKLLLVLGLTGWHLYLCVEVFQYAIYGENQDRPFLSAMTMILIMLPVGVCLLHLVFTTIFTIGVHHENDGLRVYLAYFIVELAVASGWAAYNLYTGIIDNYIQRNSFWWCKIFPVVLNILWTIYFIVFFGSDLQLLKKAGEETVLPRLVMKEQDRQHNNVYSNATPPTPDRRKPLFPVEELEMLRQEMGVTFENVAY